MTQTVRWYPTPAPNIVAYRLLYSDTGPEGPFLERAPAILNVQAGANWDANAGVFFFVDDEIGYRLYRLHTLDTQGTEHADTAVPPFGPNNDPFVAPEPHTFPLNHDTGGIDALRYVDPNGQPVAGATIRVYAKIDWDMKRYSKVVGLTKTDATGRWISPIFVTPGDTFVVRYELPNTWGPDGVEVTV